MYFVYDKENGLPYVSVESPIESAFSSINGQTMFGYNDTVSRIKTMLNFFFSECGQIDSIKMNKERKEKRITLLSRQKNELPNHSIMTNIQIQQKLIKFSNNHIKCQSMTSAGIGNCYATEENNNITIPDLKHIRDNQELIQPSREENVQKNVNKNISSSVNHFEDNDLSFAGFSSKEIQQSVSKHEKISDISENHSTSMILYLEENNQQNVPVKKKIYSTLQNDSSLLEIHMVDDSEDFAQFYSQEIKKSKSIYKEINNIAQNKLETQSQSANLLEEDNEDFPGFSYEQYYASASICEKFNSMLSTKSDLQI